MFRIAYIICVFFVFYLVNLNTIQNVSCQNAENSLQVVEGTSPPGKELGNVGPTEKYSGISEKGLGSGGIESRKSSSEEEISGEASVSSGESLKTKRSQPYNPLGPSGEYSGISEEGLGSGGIESGESSGVEGISGESSVSSGESLGTKPSQPYNPLGPSGESSGISGKGSGIGSGESSIISGESSGLGSVESSPVSQSEELPQIPPVREPPLYPPVLEPPQDPSIQEPPQAPPVQEPPSQFPPGRGPPLIPPGQESPVSSPGRGPPVIPPGQEGPSLISPTSEQQNQESGSSQCSWTTIGLDNCLFHYLSMIPRGIMNAIIAIIQFIF